MLSICLLVSGQLGFRVLKELQQSSYTLGAVFTDRRSTIIIDFCRARNIPLFIGNPRNGQASHFIQSIHCEVLLSVNYLFLIEADLINLPQQYAINLHGSLLPRYRGRSPHVWAIINGETETGVTAHLMDAEVDNGDIVRQVRLAIPAEATGGDILAQFNECYPELVFNVLRDIETKTIKPHRQDKSKATYFGKRTPTDGQINWDWSRERIRNWIRAQARPYPGAFTYYEGQKITIHQSRFDDHGFDNQQANGTVLAYNTSSLIVKTTNGALSLESIEEAWAEDIIIGSRLGSYAAVLL